MKTTTRKYLMLSLLAAGSGMAALLAQEKGVDPFAAPGSGNPEEVNPAASPEPDKPSMVQVRVEFVEMSHEMLTELLFLDEPGNSDATELRKTVGGLVKAGEAKVLETMMVVAQSGYKATSESIREFIYATEYEPPEVPDTSKKGSLTPEDIKALWSMATPALPTAFETRNLGSILEVKATIGTSGKTVNLELMPEIIWHVGNTVWMERKDGLGNISRVEMPGFYKVAIDTSVTCVPGQYTLIAALSPKDQNGVTDMTRKVMVFVRCDLQEVKK